MTKADFSFQIPAAKSIFEMATSGKYIAAVLAAAPSAGKSTITIRILNHFFETFPELNVVVLTHNQNLLKDQMLEGFQDGHVTPLFTFGGFGSKTQVQVGLPSSRAKIEKCDLLVVDEAHHYYGAAMIDKIIAEFKPKFQVLMTGSPSVYNEANQKAGRNVYGMYYISGEELVAYDVYSYVVMDVVRTESKDVVTKFMMIENRIKMDMRLKMDKIMIACKTISEAKTLATYLTNNGRKVSISTSENDGENEEIANYKSGKTNVLIVVNKGILGFSDNDTTGMVDLKNSADIDARFQLLTRVFRKHKNGCKKFYMSSAANTAFNKEVSILSRVIEIMKPEVFRTYTKAA